MIHCMVDVRMRVKGNNLNKFIFHFLTLVNRVLTHVHFRRLFLVFKKILFLTYVPSLTSRQVNYLHTRFDRNFLCLLNVIRFCK